MNLLRDPWLLAHSDADGRRYVTIAEVLSGSAVPWHPRASLNAAQYEFLVGIVQATMTPADIDEWEDLYHSPPTQEDIQARLERLAPAFELFGVGRRFMQDANVRDAEARPVYGLLFGYPGENTIAENKDLFVKRDEISVLGVETAALAIFALQSWASGSGPGYNTSPRGGGPITVLALDQTTWRTVWRNVLTIDDLACIGWDRAPVPADFPWMSDLPASGQQKVKPGTVHPVCMYFPQPRRLWLEAVDATACQVSGVVGESSVTAVRTAQDGYNYSGLGWRHPLTTFIEAVGKPDKSNHLHGGAALDFRDWLGLAIDKVVRDKPTKSAPDGKVVSVWHPPLNVTANRRSRAELVGGQTRLWCFGLNAANATIINWVEATMPLVLDLPPDGPFDREVARLIGGVQDVRGLLRVALMRDTSPLPGAAHGASALALSSALTAAEGRYIAILAPAFDVLLGRVAAKVRADGAVCPTMREEWRATLEAAAITAFDEAADGIANPRQAFHRAECRRFLRNAANGDKVREILVIAKKETTDA